jgi:hypothetical protein
MQTSEHTIGFLGTKPESLIVISASSGTVRLQSLTRSTIVPSDHTFFECLLQTLEALFNTMANRRPRRLAQSLLSFPENACLVRPNDVLVSRGASDRAFDVHFTANPPPDLPSELWEMILSPLGNFLVKKFRLVHPLWASIGARYLFQTVYLSVHQHSVAGLIQIAGSIHSVLVRKMVWSPFTLSPDCLEADRWRSTYKNLLENFKHAKLVELHQIYRRLFRDQTQNQQADQMSDLDTTMGKLVNCCELIIHDGQQDIESACSDPGFRRAVQRSSPFHRASIWVSKPPLNFNSDGVVDDSYGVIDDFIVKSCVQIIGTLENCPMITAVTVSCQEWLWDKVTEGLVHSRDRRRQSQWRGYRTAFIGVRSLCLILGRTINCYRHACSRSPEVSLEYFGSFELLELVNLTVKVVPVKSRILDDTSIDGAESDREPGYHEIFCEEPIADTDSTRSTSDSLTSDTGWRSDGAADPAEELDPILYYHMFVEETKLKLGLIRFPKLEKLTIGNVLIDTDLLLAWCWFQPRLPQSRLTITIVDVVIFDELALRDFFSALHSLNVELIYDCRSTGYSSAPNGFTNYISRTGGSLLSPRDSMT